VGVSVVNNMAMESFMVRDNDVADEVFKCFVVVVVANEIGFDASTC
jgi:hypothetical protein